MQADPEVDRLVVGGGIAGLSAAERLVEIAKREPRSAKTLLLLERSDRLGGVVRTHRENGFLLEEGPDSFLTAKPAALESCERLGLSGELLPVNAAFRRSFVLRGGRLLPLSEGIYLLAPGSLSALARSPLFSLRGKFRMALEPWVPRRAGGGDESVAAFIRRRLGEEAYVRLAQPIASAMHTADPEEMSLAALFPQFAAFERDPGSVLRGISRLRSARSASGPRYGLFATLRGGLSRWIDAIVARLPAGSVRLSAEVRSLAPEGPGWLARLSGGETVRARAVCLAVPPSVAARLLEDAAPVLSGFLSEIRALSSLTVYLGFPRDRLSHPLDGIGMVVPRTEGLRISACSFASTKFEDRSPPGTVLLRAFVGARPTRLLASQADEEVVRCVLSDLAPVLGIAGGAEPILARVFRHAGVMPLYAMGHLDRLARIREETETFQGLALAGNAYGGVGLPDCVESGRAAAERLER